MQWKADKTLGYIYATGVDHPNAGADGKIYQHVYLMSEHIGRPLEPGECVHHIDRDRANNDIENLQLMSIREHSLLHAIEDRGYTGPAVTTCAACGDSFEHREKLKRKYCSHECSDKGSRKFHVTRDELHRLVWSMPTAHVASLLGVSDVAVAKRCKSLQVNKPPRGYWNKVRAAKVVPVIPPLAPAG